MVDKKTMSVHSRAYLFLVNTADVPLTYRNFGVLLLHQFFFFILSFDKKKRLFFNHRLFHYVFQELVENKQQINLNTVWNRAEKFRKGEFKKNHTYSYTTGPSHILIT